VARLKAYGEEVDLPRVPFMVNVEKSDLLPPVLPEGVRIYSGRGFAVKKKRPQRSVGVQELDNPPRKRKSKELIEAEEAMAAPDKFSLDAALSLLRKRKPQPEGALAKHARREREKEREQEVAAQAKLGKATESGQTVVIATASPASKGAPSPSEVT
tara:strand:+ start:124 stop:594 length:471 start_codon:yes stop_codon:yes gene_type:complete